MAATVANHPKRFVGLGTLPMQAPELAVKEMERCVKELGFPGVQIGSHINEWDLNAPELFPVYSVSTRGYLSQHAVGPGTVLGAGEQNRNMSPPWQGGRKMPDDMLHIAGNTERVLQKEWTIPLEERQVEMLHRPARS